MANLSAQDKLKQICDALRVETLKPAEEEANTIVNNAKEQAKRIIQEAQETAQKLVASAEEEANRKLKQGESSLAQAGKRSVESLKQAIEQKIFKESLAEWLDSVFADHEVGARLVNALIQGVESQGFSGDITAYVAKHISPRAVNEILGKTVLAKLKGKSVVVGEFSSGVQLKVHERNWVLDLSSDALLTLLTRYLQKDFREMIFHSGS